jgi:hypothetical protein
MSLPGTGRRVYRTREAVGSESMADRVRRMQVALEKYADTGK